jgi:hypothetical protein
MGLFLDYSWLPQLSWCLWVVTMYHVYYSINALFILIYLFPTNILFETRIILVFCDYSQALGSLVIHLHLFIDYYHLCCVTNLFDFRLLVLWQRRVTNNQVLFLDFEEDKRV